MMPQMSGLTFALFVGGLLWLGLWRGRTRLFGLIPASLATLMLLATPIPDLLISGDGRHVGIAGEGDRLLMLRNTRSEFTRDNLTELAGFTGEPLPLDEWPGARCNPDFCAIGLQRDGREWHVLMSRSRNYVDLSDLAAACAQSDIVVSDRRLPRTCVPRWLKADRPMLAQTGGLAIVLSDPPRMTTVAESQGEHGWWRGAESR
jgi:competence protein ComEC